MFLIFPLTVYNVIKILNIEKINMLMRPVGLDGFHNQTTFSSTNKVEKKQMFKKFTKLLIGSTDKKL
jgi:hypothetical protein